MTGLWRIEDERIWERMFEIWRNKYTYGFGRCGIQLGSDFRRNLMGWNDYAKKFERNWKEGKNLKDWGFNITVWVGSVHWPTWSTSPRLWSLDWSKVRQSLLDIENLYSLLGIYGHHWRSVFGWRSVDWNIDHADI